MRTGFTQRSFYVQCSTHLEQSTLLHHLQLGRHCKNFQKETQNVLLHQVLPVLVDAREPSACDSSSLLPITRTVAVFIQAPSQDPLVCCSTRQCWLQLWVSCTVVRRCCDSTASSAPTTKSPDSTLVSTHGALNAACIIIYIYRYNYLNDEYFCY